MIRIVIIGAGNVASHLLHAFNAIDNIAVVQMYNRTAASLMPFQNLTETTTDITTLKSANIYIIAVTDDHINSVSAQLQLQGQLVVHTSGAIPMSAINEKHRRGVFYPLQTFSKNKAVDFNSIPICLEAEQETDLPLLEQLANSLSNKVYRINSSQRKTLHVAAVFVCNFVNHLYQKGEEICNEHQVPFEILHPLIQETAQKITQLSPIDSQTGPAIRNDQSVLDEHLSKLNTNTQKEIYKLLTNSIQKTHGNKL